MKLKLLPEPLLAIPAQLALDRELLKKAAEEKTGFLRFWNFKDEAIVLGLAQEEEKYINLENQKKDKINIVRRFSGGGTVFLQSGCLVYSLFFPLVAPFKRYDVAGAYALAFAPLIEAFRKQNLTLEFYQPCDLAIAGKKVAGNAQAQRYGAVLVHGSFLINPDLAKIKRYLKEPDIVPEYRQGRKHEDFLLPLSTLGFTEESLRKLLKKAYCEDA